MKPMPAVVQAAALTAPVISSCTPVVLLNVPTPLATVAPPLNVARLVNIEAGVIVGIPVALAMLMLVPKLPVASTRALDAVLVMVVTDVSAPVTSAVPLKACPQILREVDSLYAVNGLSTPVLRWHRRAAPRSAAAHQPSAPQS